MTYWGMSYIQECWNKFGNFLKGRLLHLMWLLNHASSNHEFPSAIGNYETKMVWPNQGERSVERPFQERYWTAAIAAIPAVDSSKVIDYWIATKIRACCSRDWKFCRRVWRELRQCLRINSRRVHSRTTSKNCGIRWITKFHWLMKELRYEQFSFEVVTMQTSSDCVMKQNSRWISNLNDIWGVTKIQMYTLYSQTLRFLMFKLMD